MEQKYLDYLKSKHWDSVKNLSKAIFKEGCIFTGNKPYDLHHLNYFNLGRERFWYDLVPLRREEHERFHEYVKANGKKYYNLLDYANYYNIAIGKTLIKFLEGIEQYNENLYRVGGEIPVDLSELELCSKKYILLKTKRRKGSTVRRRKGTKSNPKQNLYRATNEDKIVRRQAIREAKKEARKIAQEKCLKYFIINKKKKQKIFDAYYNMGGTEKILIDEELIALFIRCKAKPEAIEFFEENMGKRLQKENLLRSIRVGEKPNLFEK